MKVLGAAGLAAVLALVTPTVASAAGPPAPIDPQNWSFQDNLTWSDYHALPGTDYSNPDIQPTVDSLAARVVSLATTLHRLDADLPAGALADLDARLVAAERSNGGSAGPDHERHVALLHRQRNSLADLAERRAALAAQLERASLMLQNIRLDLVKLRSSGVGAFADATGATQEARALSRDIGHVLDAAREVRKL
jgi:serine/threonine-protein kinase